MPAADDPETESNQRQRRCWFCDTPLTGGRHGNTAREHVIPLWLQEGLGLYLLEITPTWHSAPLGELLNQRKQTWGTLKAGRVCSTCNNGWMSDLETSARPILLALVRGERTVASLSSAESTVVARWAAKTIFTLSASVQEQRVPSTHYHLLRQWPTELPAGVHVVAAQQPDLSAPAHYAIDATWKMSRKAQNSGEDRAVRGDSYKGYLQLGELILLVLWWPLGSEWVLSFEENLCQRLWPPSAKVLEHPPPDELPLEIREVAGKEKMYELDHNSGTVALRYTQSVNAFHRGDLPDWLLESFGIEPVER